jgi:hypothetical protein
LTGPGENEAAKANKAIDSRRDKVISTPAMMFEAGDYELTADDCIEQN